MKKINVQDFLIYKYRYIIGTAIVIVSAAIVLFLQLGTLLPGISGVEAESGLSSLNFKQIIISPVHLTYELVQWATIQIFGFTAWGLRLPSVIFGALTVLFFYVTMHIWHRPRIAVLGSLLLVTASWFIHTARLGIPAITLPFYVAALLAASSWLFTKRKTYHWQLLVAVVVSILAVYEPYLLVLVATIAMIRRRELVAIFRLLNKKWRYTIIAIVSIGVSPLLYSLAAEPGLIKELFGVTELPTIEQYLRNLVNTFGYIFWRAQEEPRLHLGTLPMLDIFTATMTALGLYHYERHMSLKRTKILFISFGAVILLTSLSSDQSHYAVFIPFVYIFAATGIITLMNQWYRIFPKNPIARIAAFAPMAILIAVTVLYHTQRYFVAWAYSPTTISYFNSDTKLLQEELKALEATPHGVLVIAGASDIERFDFSSRELGKEVTTIETVAEVDPSEIRGYSYVLVSSKVKLPETVTEKLPPIQKTITSEKTKDFRSFDVYNMIDVRLEEELVQ